MFAISVFLFQKKWISSNECCCLVVIIQWIWMDSTSSSSCETHICREKEKRRKKKIHVNIHLGTKFYRFVFFCLVYPRPTTTVFIRIVWWKKKFYWAWLFRKKSYHYWFYRMDIEYVCRIVFEYNHYFEKMRMNPTLLGMVQFFFVNLWSNRIYHLELMVGICIVYFG